MEYLSINHTYNNLLPVMRVMEIPDLFTIIVKNILLKQPKAVTYIRRVCLAFDTHIQLYDLWAAYILPNFDISPKTIKLNTDFSIQRIMAAIYPKYEDSTVIGQHNTCCLGVLELESGDILTWSEDGELTVWNPNEKNASIISLQGHEEAVNGALKRKNGEIITWSLDGTLKVWNFFLDNPLILSLNAHEWNVEGVVELENGLIMSWGDHYIKKIWDLSLDTPLIEILETTKEITENENFPIYSSTQSIKPLKNGNRLIYGNKKRLEIYNLSLKNPLVQTLEGHLDCVTDAILLKDGIIISCSTDKSVRIWRPSLM